MADTNFDKFDKRMARIMRNHERLSKGYVTKVTRDGLIVARPRRTLLDFIPWRTILILLIAAMAAKVFLYVQLGPEAYEARVANLAVGTELEKVGAYVLSADQATLWLASKVEELKP